MSRGQSDPVADIGRDRLLRALQIVGRLKGPADVADAFNNVCACENCQKTTLSDQYAAVLNEIDRRLTAEGLDDKIVFLIHQGPAQHIVWEEIGQTRPQLLTAHIAVEAQPSQPLHIPAVASRMEAVRELCLDFAPTLDAHRGPGGWDTPAADSKNYDEQGQAIKPDKIIRLCL